MDRNIIELALTEYKKEIEFGLEENMFTWHLFKLAFIKGYKDRKYEERKGETGLS